MRQGGASPGGLGKVRIPGSSSLGRENRKLETKARSPCSSEGWEGGCGNKALPARSEGLGGKAGVLPGGQAKSPLHL